MPPRQNDPSEVEFKPGFWAVIPTAILYDDSLPAAAKLLYASINSLTHKEGYCYATNGHFMKHFNMAETTVKRLINQLEKAGYIERFIEYDEQTHEVLSRKIFLTVAGAVPNLPGSKNGPTPPSKNGPTPGSKNGPHNNIINNNIPPIVPQHGGRKAVRRSVKKEPGTSQLFERFWNRYPARHGRKNGKQEALKMWNRLSVTDESFNRIMSGLEAYIQSDDVKRGFAMDASRWLKGRRWEDESCGNAEPVGHNALLPEEDLEDYEW